jgi:hypothetical protein
MARIKWANHRIGAERSAWMPDGNDGRPVRSDAGPVDGPREAPTWLNQPQEDPAAPSTEFAVPVRVDEIAVAAMALSDGLQAATRELPELTESHQLRRELDHAADAFRAVAGELETTAGALVRLAATDGGPCGVTWGICEDHGITLLEVGDGAVICRTLGCRREQTAAVERCQQPAAYRVVDVTGPALLVCTGHAVACRLHLDGAVITLVSDSLELL